MFSKYLILILALTVAVPLVQSPVASQAQDTASKQGTLLKKEELDQLLAPIALYSDDLLSSVLMASTYPLEVVQATRWVKEPTNAKLEGDALTKALDEQDWDPSVKSLTQFPEILEMMSDQLEWTQKLGDAVLAQEADVMDQIQYLRDKADEAGNLESNEKQTVSKKSSGGKEYIYIEPANPDVVYVPVYEPTVVYGSWWYPDYPPYYWPPPAGGAFVSGFFWGAGATVASSIWGWGNCNWHDRNININVNKYNKINVNKPKITSNRWEHNAYHRRGVKYNNNNVRQKYAKHDVRTGQKDRLDYRGHSGKQVLKPNGDRRPGTGPKPGERPNVGDDKRPGGGPKAGDRKPGDRPDVSKKPDKRPSAGDNKRPSTAGKKPSSTVTKKQPSTAAKKRPSSSAKKSKGNSAFSKPTKKATAHKHASRGRSSMGGSRGGGGRGGGRGGGGRRR